MESWCVDLHITLVSHLYVLEIFIGISVQPCLNSWELIPPCLSIESIHKVSHLKLLHRLVSFWRQQQRLAREAWLDDWSKLTCCLPPITAINSDIDTVDVVAYRVVIAWLTDAQAHQQK